MSKIAPRIYDDELLPTVHDDQVENYGNEQYEDDDTQSGTLNDTQSDKKPTPNYIDKILANKLLVLIIILTIIIIGVAVYLIYKKKTGNEEDKVPDNPEDHSQTEEHDEIVNSLSIEELKKQRDAMKKTSNEESPNKTSQFNEEKHKEEVKMLTERCNQLTTTCDQLNATCENFMKQRNSINAYILQQNEEIATLKKKVEEKANTTGSSATLEVQPPVQVSVQPSVQAPVQPSVQPSVQAQVESSDEHDEDEDQTDSTSSEIITRTCSKILANGNYCKGKVYNGTDKCKRHQLA